MGACEMDPSRAPPLAWRVTLAVGSTDRPVSFPAGISAALPPLMRRARPRRSAMSSRPSGWCCDWPAPRPPPPRPRGSGMAASSTGPRWTAPSGSGRRGCGSRRTWFGGRRPATRLRNVVLGMIHPHIPPGWWVWVTLNFATVPTANVVSIPAEWIQNCPCHRGKPPESRIATATNELPP